MSAKPDISTAFLDASRRYLTGHYLPKIARCVDRLDGVELWWRPNERSNSVGNLILHLCGNVRQYIISGVGAETDERDRDREFSAREAASGADLLALLRSTVEDVDRILRDLDPLSLQDVRTIQGRPMTMLDAVYHAVEHFSMHAGQIIYITKQLKDCDLGFYDFGDGSVRRRW